MDKQLSVETIINDNSAKSFELLYDAYAPALYVGILRLIADKTVADEILFDSFITITQTIQRFNPKHSSLFCWMLRISIQQCRQHAGVTEQEIREKFCPVTNSKI